MPETVEQTVFRLGELTPKARQQVIDDLGSELHENLDSSWLTENFNSDLEAKGWDGLKVAGWSLNSCQGDGVAFEGTVDLDAMSRHEDHTHLVKVLKAFQLRDITLSLRITHSGRYYHAYFMSVELEASHSERQLTDIEEHLRIALESWFKDEVQDLSSEFETDGYSQIEYSTNEEAAIREADERDLWFNEDGEQIDGPQPVAEDENQLMLF